MQMDLLLQDMFLIRNCFFNEEKIVADERKSLDVKCRKKSRAKA